MSLNRTQAVGEAVVWDYVSATSGRMTPAATVCFESAPNHANIPLFPIGQMDVDGEMARYYPTLWLKTCRRPLGQHKHEVLRSSRRELVVATCGFHRPD